MMEHSHQHTLESKPERGLLEYLALPVGVALAVGAFWYLLSATDTEGLLPVILIIVTLGLALVFGASMERMRGFGMSIVVAATVVISVFLAAGTLSENREDGYSYFVLFAVVMTMFVLTFWLIGVASRSFWRRVRER